jgi:hypothetical protein
MKQLRCDSVGWVRVSPLKGHVTPSTVLRCLATYSRKNTANREALATLSPYQTEHINRFGNYVLNPNRTPEPLEQHLQIALA